VPPLVLISSTTNWADDGIPAYAPLSDGEGIGAAGRRPRRGNGDSHSATAQRLQAVERDEVTTCGEPLESCQLANPQRSFSKGFGVPEQIGG